MTSLAWSAVRVTLLTGLFLLLGGEPRFHRRNSGDNGLEGSGHLGDGGDGSPQLVGGHGDHQIAGAEFAALGVVGQQFNRHSSACRSRSVNDEVIDPLLVESLFGHSRHGHGLFAWYHKVLGGDEAKSSHCSKKVVEPILR